MLCLTKGFARHSGVTGKAQRIIVIVIERNDGVMEWWNEKA